MNKQRRQQIRDLIDEAVDLKAKIEEVLQEEQDYYDNMPESLQCSERGENAESAISDLEEASSCLDECLSSLESSIEL